MTGAFTSVTSKGQVTIPAEVRRALGIEPGDQVRFELTEDGLRLSKVEWTLERIAGSVRPANQPEDWEARIREAKEERLARRHGASQA